MKMELIKGDSLEVSDETPMYNPQGLPLNRMIIESQYVVCVRCIAAG